MKKFALIGAAGYIAPRHLKAIADTGNDLVAAYDLFDSVGRLDYSFPSCKFFTEQPLFDRYCNKVKNTEQAIDWFTICTPNYTHDAFIRYGLRMDANVICEKPVVLNPWNVDALADVEKETGKEAYTILQLRHHPSILSLKRKVDSDDSNRVYDIDLTYITSRGNWYYASWKGDVHKSGGVATNIGVHFYDMLQWIFGTLKKNVVHIMSFDRVSGYLEFSRARVRYFLSINEDCLPPQVAESGIRTYRTLTIDNETFEFSQGFTELHTISYQAILSGKGFRISEARPCIEIVHDIRKSAPIGLKGDYHPMAKLSLAKHPFGWDDMKY